VRRGEHQRAALGGVAALHPEQQGADPVLGGQRPGPAGRAAHRGRPAPRVGDRVAVRRAGRGRGEQRVGEHGGPPARDAHDRHRAGAALRAPLLDAVRGQHQGAPAGRGHPLQGRAVEQAVGGPGGVDHGRHAEQVGQRAAALGDRAGGQLAEATAGERDEVGVGVGQRDDAPGRRHRGQLVEPGRRDRAAAAGPDAPVRFPDGVPGPHRGGRLHQVGVDRHADRLAHRRPGRGGVGQCRDQPAQPAVRGQRGGQVVVGEQGGLAGHGGQPARHLGDRVEQRERGRAGPVGARRVVRIGHRGAGRRGQRQHRQQHPDRGQPGPGTVLRHPVHVDQQLVDTRLAQRQGGLRGAAQRHVQPDRELPAGRQFPGQRGELRGDRVGAGRALQGVAQPALGVQRVAPLHPHDQVVDRPVAGVGEGADHGQGVRAARGDQPGPDLGQVQPQRTALGPRHHAVGGSAGERHPGERPDQQQQGDRDQGRDRLHAVSSSSSVARRISRRSSA
jgi:hypothetical protein